MIGLFDVWTSSSVSEIDCVVIVQIRRQRLG